MTESEMAEIQRALGRLEGKADSVAGAVQALTAKVDNLHSETVMVREAAKGIAHNSTRLGNHAERLASLEHHRSRQKGMITAITVIGGLAAGMLGSYLKAAGKAALAAISGN